MKRVTDVFRKRIFRDPGLTLAACSVHPLPRPMSQCRQKRLRPVGTAPQQRQPGLEPHFSYRKVFTSGFSSLGSEWGAWSCCT